MFEANAKNKTNAFYHANKVIIQLETEEKVIENWANKLKEQSKNYANFGLGLIAACFLTSIITFSLQLVLVATLITIVGIEVKRFKIIKDFKTHKGLVLYQEKNKANEELDKEYDKVNKLVLIQNDFEKQLTSINKAIGLVRNNANDSTLLQNPIIKDIAKKQIKTVHNRVDTTTKTKSKQYINVPKTNR